MYNLILVDDERDVGDFLCSFIEEEQLGFRVTGVFHDGLQAWQFVQSHRVDCVITDIKMPFMTGMELAQNIQRADFDHETRVILLSGYGEFEYAVQGIQAGIWDYLLKPIDFDKLTLALQKAYESLESSGAKKQKQYEQLYVVRELFLRDVCTGRLKARQSVYQDSQLQFGMSAEALSGTLLYARLPGTEEKAMQQQLRQTLLRCLPDVYLLKCENENIVICKLGGDIETWELFKHFQEIHIFGKMPFECLSELPEVFTEIQNSDSEQLPENAQIDKALEYIREHYMQQCTRDEVAAACYMNPAYFGRMFKRETGETFTDYLIKVRMEAAIELLRQKCPVEQIPERVGYSSARHFNRVFKEYTGYTLRDFRTNKL